MKKGVVVDLDGTLLRLNTFNVFVSYLLKFYLKRFELYKIIILLLIILKRKLRFCSHSDVKYNILKHSVKFIESSSFDKFIDLLVLKYNAEVLRVVDLYKEKGYKTCLATAAPEVYVKIISEKFNFDLYCASVFVKDKSKWVENVRKEKLQNVKKIFKKNNLSINIVLSDHYDDLSLFKNSLERNIVVEPDMTTINILNNASIKYDIIKTKKV